MKTETFQDPSALMKRALFQSLAIGVVAVVLYMFCVEPCQTSLQKAKKEHVALQSQQTQMVRDLKGADQVKGRLDALQGERKAYLDGLLEPLLESYAMRAKSLLDPLAADVGLTVGDYAELPARRLPLPQPMAPQLYARKPARGPTRRSCRSSSAWRRRFRLRRWRPFPSRPRRIPTTKRRHSCSNGRSRARTRPPPS